VQDPRVIAPTNAKTELRPSSEGKVAQFFTEDYDPKKAGEMVPGTETPFSPTPVVGSSPVEIFKNGSVHFGNPIQKVSSTPPAAAAAAPAAAPAAAAPETSILEIPNTSPEEKIAKLIKFGLSAEKAKAFVDSGDFKQYQDAYTDAKDDATATNTIVGALREELVQNYGVEKRKATEKKTAEVILAASEEGVGGKLTVREVLAGIKAKSILRMGLKNQIEELRKTANDPDTLEDIARITDELETNSFDEQAIRNTIEDIQQDTAPAEPTKFTPPTEKDFKEQERRSQKKVQEDSTALGAIKTGDVQKIIEYFK
jgi:hypothetical protein